MVKVHMMSQAAFVFAAISLAHVATGAFIFERGDAEEKELDHDHKEKISDHETIIGERKKETAEHRNEVSASKKDTANCNNEVNDHSKKMGHRRTKKIGHRLEKNIAHRKKTEETGDPSMDIDSWTQSAPLLEPCAGPGASVVPLSSSSPSMSSPLGGATLVEEEKSDASSDEEKSDADETASEDDDDESDDAEEGTERVVDVLELSGQELKLTVADRKTKRAYVSLGSDSEKARITAKDANAKAMTARLAHGRAQRKAGIAAFKMVEALTAEKEAKAAKGCADEAKREADTADKKFTLQEDKAKSAAKKALKIARMSGRLWEKAGEQSAESVAKAIKDLEDAQKAADDQSGEDPQEIAEEKKAAAEQVVALRNAAREEMEKAALLKAKAAEVGKALIDIATPHQPHEPGEVAATTAAPMHPADIPKAMKKYCGASADHKQPFSVKDFYDERALPPAALSSMSGL